MSVIGDRIVSVVYIYNEGFSTPGQSRVCSNPRYIYYYDDETIPFQSFLCRLGFSPFFMKFYEKKIKNDVIDHPRKNLEINSVARRG